MKTTFFVTLTVVEFLTRINGNSIKDNSIIWNGCETPIFVKLYQDLTVDKPKICSTRLPDYLEGIRPQKTKSSFFIEAISYTNPASLLIAVTAKHKANNGKIKSRKFPKLNSFTAVYISARTVKGFDVGKFILGDQVETNDSFKMGYCCGKSRHQPNFFELQAASGEWTTDVIFDAGNHKRPVIFDVTVVQSKKIYWNLPPYTVIIR